MNGTNTITRRLAHANIASNVGAGMLGIAVGLLFHNALMRYFPGLLLLVCPALLVWGAIELRDPARRREKHGDQTGAAP